MSTPARTYPASRSRPWVMLGLLILGTALTAAFIPAAESPPAEPSTPKASAAELPADAAPAEPVRFSVQVGDDVIPYEVFGLFVMPGETVPVEAVFTAARADLELHAGKGRVDTLGAERWQWTAPAEPGLYRLRVVASPSGQAVRLNAFVKEPYDIDDRRLNGYRIGTYQGRPLNNLPAYNPPGGLVEARPAWLDVHVSPHFTLRQFLCKQTSDYPKYLLLRERLLLKLEMILAAVQDRGIPAQTLHVMSAYRTPYYNRSIGNRTTYSRHLYGGAADVFVDVDEDGVMDDLDGDGRTTEADARVLAGIVEGMGDEAWYTPLVGGLGIYGPAPHRGPFIHVDVRGQRARW